MGVCCTKTVMAKDTMPRSKTPKTKDPTIKETVNNLCFVDIINKDGSTSQYIPEAPTVLQASPNDIISLNLETIDQKKSSLQIGASEKLAVVKQKACELMSLNDIILIFEGKVLDLEGQVGNNVPQGGTLDIIPI